MEEKILTVQDVAMAIGDDTAGPFNNMGDYRKLVWPENLIAVVLASRFVNPRPELIDVPTAMVDFSRLPKDFTGSLYYVLYTVLAEHEREVLLAYFRDGKSLDDIKNMDMSDKKWHSTERVRQLLARAIRKLRAGRQSHLIFDGVEAYMTNQARTVFLKEFETTLAEAEERGYQRGLQFMGGEMPTQKEPTPSEIEEWHLSELKGLSYHSYHILIRKGITTIGQLVKYNWYALSSLRGIGTVSLTEIANAVNALGLTIEGQPHQERQTG